MSSRQTLKFSLQTRFALALLLSIFSFAVIVFGMMLSFSQVRKEMGAAVESQVQQAVESSNIARELGLLLSRLALLEANYGDVENFSNEIEEIRNLLVEHPHNYRSPAINELHDQLYNDLQVYLQHYSALHELLKLMTLAEKKLEERFFLLRDELNELYRDASSRGVNADSYLELGRRLDRFQIELLEIVRANLKTKPLPFTASGVRELFGSPRQIMDLLPQAKVFSEKQGMLGALGSDLEQRLESYQQLLADFQREMSRNSQLISGLHHLMLDVMEQMGLHEQQQASGVVMARKQIDEAISSTSMTVWVLLAALAGLLGLIQYHLYLHHIRKPMDSLHNRFLHFNDGDYTTPIALGRDDEWGRIETVFNEMLADLHESWSTVQESERRYRSIFDSISVGIFQTSIDGDLLNMNPAMAEMFEFKLADISNTDKVVELYYADKHDRQILVDRLRREEIVNQHEIQFRRSSGELFWGSVNCHLVRDSDENILFIEGTVDDVSRRHKAAEELQALKEYLHAIVDAMPSILISVNRGLSVSLWNRRVVEVTGLAEDDALGKPLGDVFTLIDRTQFLPAVRETLDSGKISRVRRLPGRDSQTGRFFDLVVYPLGAGVEEVVLHVDDVTEKAQIEEVMIQSEKMLSVGSLAAGMAHEINNPLASVLQNVQVLDQRLSPALKKNQQVAEQLGITIEQVADYARLRGFEQMIKSIGESGRRAARIIENMLNFTRKSSSTFIPCSLAELADKTLELAGSDYDMKHHFDFRKIKLTRDYRDVPAVPCESSQIQQVILSLLKNSAQAIGSSTEDPEIIIRLFLQGDMACLQVEDNGAGMDEETARRIFEPFFTTKEVGVGTGLGLSVAYFLISENHKGRLSVTSEVGKGTCFSVQLPLKRDGNVAD